MIKFINSKWNLPVAVEAVYSPSEYTERGFLISRYGGLSVIYGLFCVKTQEVYVGSTQTLDNRIKSHLRDSSNWRVQRDMELHKSDFYLIIFATLPGNLHPKLLMAAEQLYFDAIPHSEMYNIMFYAIYRQRFIIRHTPITRGIMISLLQTKSIPSPQEVGIVFNAFTPEAEDMYPQVRSKEYPKKKYYAKPKPCMSINVVTGDEGFFDSYTSAGNKFGCSSYTISQLIRSGKERNGYKFKDL